MYRSSPFQSLASLLRTAALLALAGIQLTASATEFAVSPIRVELKPGAMNETITVTNEASKPLRVSMKLMEWTQDSEGKDVFTESSDLIYFPRQMEVTPNSRRLVRVGGKALPGTMERSYRLFIEEQPEATATAGRPQVAIYFRFGVPIFHPPADAKPHPEIAEPTISNGKISVQVRNTGNQHFRLTKVIFVDDAGYRQEVQGWYSLAGTQRTYTATIPADVCRKAKAFRVELEGENLRFDRSVNVSPAACA